MSLFSEPKKKRKYIPKGDKIKVLERQNDKCAKCKKPINLKIAKFDHKKPIALGGSDTLRNIWALCPECDHIKTTQDRAKIAKKKQKEKEAPTGFLEGVLPKAPRGRRRKKSLLNI